MDNFKHSDLTSLDIAVFLRAGYVIDRRTAPWERMRLRKNAKVFVPYFQNKSLPVWYLLKSIC